MWMARLLLQFIKSLQPNIVAFSLLVILTMIRCRVKITEASGRIIYSKILFFSTRSTEVVVSPTIIKHGQLLHITVKQKDYTISIFDSNGALVKKQRLAQGLNTIPVTIGAGIYFYRVANGDELAQKTGRIIID